MDVIKDLGSVRLLAAGLFALIRAKKRKFDRTNQFGVEWFSSFWAKLSARSSDYFWTGALVLLVASGTILLASARIDTWGWLVMVPVGLFALDLLLGT